jgi:hypothetical protein
MSELSQLAGKRHAYAGARLAFLTVLYDSL